MTDRPLHLALRELRVDFTNPKGLIALLGVGILLGVSGPFETFAVLPLVPRILYWVCVTYLTYATGSFINMYLQYRFGAAMGPLPVQVLIGGTATAVGVWIVLFVVNSAAFGWFTLRIEDALVSFGFVWIISIVIVALLKMLSPLPDAPSAPKPPALLDRLPIEKRGPLVALAVQDHYVNVTTTRGEAMILMRLSDAMKETAPTEGLQVHRSHWVALGQIARAERIGDRAMLHLRNGTEVPASRSYIPALKQAGVFPQSARG